MGMGIEPAAMRVSIDCRYIRERPSGIGHYVQALVGRLPDLAPDVRFHLWASPRAARPLSPAHNVEETTVSAVANGIRTLAAPSRLVDLRHVDVLHATFNTIGRGVPCPSVVTVHDLMWLDRPHWCARSPWLPFKYLYYRDGILRALARAERLIAISHATADTIRKRIPDPERVRVIHHGVDPRFMPGPADLTTLARLGIRNRFFLVVGQNAPFKNHDAVRAAFFAAALPADVELVVVERLYENKRAPDERVHVIPSVTDAELIALYRSTLALVQFSRWEGFGLPALEAAGCGAPVIASAIPALDEVLGDAALRVPLSVRALARALERVAREPSLRRELGHKSVERAARFSWQQSAAAHLEVYRDAARR